jgi:hypothetical protein
MQQKPITRRQLLKALLAAGGGLTASAMLPAKWLKPVVKSGVLPAHAQTSITRSLQPIADGDFGDGTFILHIKIRVNSIPLVKTGETALSVQEGVAFQYGVEQQILPGIPDVPVKMSYQVTSGTVKDPVPALPRSKKSDSLGIADFGDQLWTVGAPPWSFLLKFSAPGCEPIELNISTED